MKRKTLQELTIKDNFMFGAVMSDEEICKRLLEMILQFPIERVEVSREKTLVYHPEYRGVRLDVYAKDEANTRYNVEMQALQKPAIGKRSRYYQAQIDMELLLSGTDYSGLPDTYVIFICDFDPFKKGKYCYRFSNRCDGFGNFKLADGRDIIFLSTKGKNDEEISLPLANFLKYVGAKLEESTEDFSDEFVKELQDAVVHVKQSREMEERYMSLELVIMDERREAKEVGLAEGKAEGLKEGKAESIIELLEELGSVPNNLRERVMGETDLEVLRHWVKLAAKADTLEQFQDSIR